MSRNILKQYTEQAGYMVAKQQNNQVADWIMTRGFIKLFFKRWLVTITDMKDFEMKEVIVRTKVVS